KHTVGIREFREFQLAPAYVDFAHGGLRDFWIAGVGASSDKPRFARAEHVAGLPGFAADDERDVEEFRGGGVVRGASLAGGISGVGGGTEGGVECVCFFAYASVLCRTPKMRSAECVVRNVESGFGRVEMVRCSTGIFCAGPHEQTDGGDAAICAFADRLLES